MRRGRRQGLSTEPPEINITAFLNLMVVLIPFLLMSAAFNQLTILELFLPAPGFSDTDNVEGDKKKLELQVILRENSLTVSDKNSGPIKAYPLTPEGEYDIDNFQKRLATIKRKNPEMTRITLLSEPQITYDKIVLIMDSSRALLVKDPGGNYFAELFPDIAVGEAPDKDE